MKKIGNWKYVATNETLLFKGPNYNGYEIDLERNCETEWKFHMKNKAWIDENDIIDLSQMFDYLKEVKPNLPVFINPIPEWLLKGSKK